MTGAHVTTQLLAARYPVPGQTPSQEHLHRWRDGATVNWLCYTKTHGSISWSPSVASIKCCLTSSFQHTSDLRLLCVAGRLPPFMSEARGSILASANRVSPGCRCHGLLFHSKMHRTFCSCFGTVAGLVVVPGCGCSNPVKPNSGNHPYTGRGAAHLISAGSFSKANSFQKYLLKNWTLTKFTQPFSMKNFENSKFIPNCQISVECSSLIQVVPHYHHLKHI